MICNPQHDTSRTERLALAQQSCLLFPSYFGYSSGDGLKTSEREDEKTEMDRLGRTAEAAEAGSRVKKEKWARARMGFLMTRGDEVVMFVGSLG